MEATSPDGPRTTALTRALATIRTLREQLDEQRECQPIAVIGIGLRLPGGIDALDPYWDALAAGRDLVRPMPANRKGPFADQWDTLPRRGGFLDEVLDFDAAFFGISPREARQLDPQQRLLLEVAWEAMENAGLPADQLAGTRTGLYLGIMWQDYRDWLAESPDTYATTGNGHNFAAGRLAYALGLTGPAVSLDTACSSSLVAVHLAAQALRRGECHTAFAAGTNLILSPRSTRLVKETRSLAPDGLCKTFDARANGFTRGEGCAVVVLKRLDHARRDGDRIHAVIHGSAVNQDGRSGGFTAPNVGSQRAVIEQALDQARLEPADIGYIEAHGTGTALGDPIEMEALAGALGRRNNTAPLPVGSVKTNLGHLEATAGLAGLIKAVLCLRHRQIPPQVHFRTLNPRIDLSGTGITVPTELADWTPAAGRYAGVSSFGMSGTNAHVILGAADPEPPTDPDPATDPVDGFELSATTDRALRELAARYADRLADLPAHHYPAFAYTASHGRTRHQTRAYVTAPDAPRAAAALRALAAGQDHRALTPGGLPDAARPAPLPRRVLDLPAYPWQREHHAPTPPRREPVTPAAGPALPAAHRVHWQPAPAVGDLPPTGALVLAGDDQRTLEALAAEAAAQGRPGTLLTPRPLEHDTPPGWTRHPLPADDAAWDAWWAGQPDTTTVLLAPLAPDPLTDSDPVTAVARLCAQVTTAATAAARAGGTRRAFALTRATSHPHPTDTTDTAAADTASGDHTAADHTAADHTAADAAAADTASGDHTAADHTAADHTAADAAAADTASGEAGHGDTGHDTGRGGSGPGHGALHGLAPVLGLELGTAWGGVIDLPHHPTPPPVRALLAFVRSQSGAPATGAPPARPLEDWAAIRDGRALVARLAPAPAHRPHLDVHPDATYLVTGALGAVGRELVEELVARGARHLLLIGRRPQDQLAPEQSALLRDLAQRGVRAHYRDGGCDTPRALAAASAALADLPPVRGVLHAAGTLRRTPVGQLRDTDFADALRAKAAGAWLLHQASAAWPLDFFVLVSSVSALWGTEHCAAYAAANGALDALAAHRAAQGLPATSVCYGPWALDGDGMADAELRERSARLGVHALTATAGRQALTATAPGPDARIVACPLDLPRLRQVMSGLRPRGLLTAPPAPRTGVPQTPVTAVPATGAPAVAAGPSFAERVADLPEGARPRAVRDHVQALVADQLGHADPRRVPPDQGFLDLGLDSITAVDLAARLSEGFATPFQAGDVFDHPTVAALAEEVLLRLSRTPTPTPIPAPAPVAAPAPAPVPGAGAGAGAAVGEGAVAVVGMAGRFPGADSVEEFWQLLVEGRDAVGTVPPERWDTAALGQGRVTTDQGGFLRDIDRFDAAFFNIPAREAESLDPQQRLLLESAWHALEYGGIDPRGLRGTRTGVFVGISSADYARLLTQGGPAGVDAYYGTGTALNAAAGRISFALGLRGPAVAVDTACSSSLVAIHLALRSLRSGESDTVLAGGVNLLLDPASWVAVSQAHMLSPDGRCRTFSADANGFVRSEGCGVLVLKRLADARRDGDQVLAVIRGSAVNQDGASAGLTAPSGTAQEAMLGAALADAATGGAEVDYLEAHGTGTSLGDPIEVGAAWRVLGPGRLPGQPLHLGSVKSNIGHCESAAGMASVIKTVLALRHGLIPANLHFTDPNPLIAWDQMNVRVAERPTTWRRGPRPRVAGVSGFGFTGTNAHLILAEAPAPVPAPVLAPAPRDPAHAAPQRAADLLLPLSAPDPQGLARLREAWRRTLEHATTDATAGEGAGGRELADLTVAAATGRAHFPYRQALLGRTREQLLDALRADEPSPAPTAAPKVAFLFSGQGSQYFGMGRELYESEPVFREAFDTCDRLLAPALGASLTLPLFHGPDRSALDETRITQPALVALQSALVALWRSWGVSPAVVMGHSVGEVSAAMCAGVLDTATGLELIRARARLMQGTERGAMLAVAAPEAAVADWAGEHGLDLAAVNGPEAIVVSGAPDPVEALARRLKQLGVKNRRLSVSHAFHSRLLDPALDELARELARFAFQAPALPIVSNVTGRLAPPDGFDADYWRRHARQPVRFADGLAQLDELGADVLLEIGPDRTLVNLAAAAPGAPRALASSLRRGRADRTGLLTAARTLYLAGQDIDWHAVHRAGHRPPAAAPRYPFARTRHWTPVQPTPTTTPTATVTAGVPAAGVPAWGGELRSPAFTGRVWATERSADYPAHLTDHRLYGTVSVPGASQTATVLSALGHGGAPVLLEDLHFPRALVLREGERYDLQTVEATTGHGTRTVSVHSLLDPARDRWQEHLAARVATPAPGADRAARAVPDRRAFIAAADRHLSGADFYRHLRALGYHLGPSFRWIADAWISGDQALIRYARPAELNEDPAGYQIHPGLLDSCLQSAVAFAVDGERVPEQERGLAIPFAIARLDFPGRPTPDHDLWGHVRATRHDPDGEGLLRVQAADIHLFHGEGGTVLALDGFRFRRAERHVLESSLRQGPRHGYEPRWSADPRPRRPEPSAAARIALLGAQGEVGRAAARACAALGHQVTPVQRPPADRAATDLVLDARFTTADADPRAARDAAWELTRSLRAADRALPYAVLSAPGQAGAPLRETLWGLLASLEAEQGDRRLLRIDLAARWAPGLLADALGQAAADPCETRLRVGADSVRVARIAPCPAAEHRPLTGAALLTGGLGALGLAAADLLSRWGAPAITLMGRSAPGPAARAAIEAITARGTALRVVRGDVTDADDCRRAVAEAGRPAPLRTVLHLAGTTADRAFDRLTADCFATVFTAKATGAHRLAAALRGQELDALVLFSSASAVLGNPGQANYAAANGYLAGLAADLRERGIPATAVDWGPWTPARDQAGGLAATDATARAIAERGVRPLLDAEAGELLRLALGGDRPRLLAVALDPDRYTRHLAGHPRAALLGPLAATRPATPTPTADGPDGDGGPGGAGNRPRGWLRERLAALDPREREDLLREHVRALAGEVLGETDAIEDDLGFAETGLDSIMVIDLRTRLSHALAADLPATVALDHPTVTRLARYAAAALPPCPGDPHHPQDPQDPYGQQDPGDLLDFGDRDDTDTDTGGGLDDRDDQDDHEMTFEELVRALQADVEAEK